MGEQRVRVCTTCGLIEPSDEQLRWTRNQCPVCGTIPKKQAHVYTVSERKRAHLRRLADQARERFVEGYCLRCEEQKTIADFPKPYKGIPSWRTHAYYCKECVRKETYRLIYENHFEEKVEERRQKAKGQSVRALQRKFRWAKADVKNLRDELQQQGALL
jgi:predicted RNA-binding Zn-ribbon protein involved in translation (DUF1610 family)